MIRDLSESTREQLLHALSRWPKAINITLWPYPLRTASYLRSHMPRDGGVSPMEKFTGVPVTHGAQVNYMFGCPVYALDTRLQTCSDSVPKWNPRARLGIYLGPSPRHDRNVSLVLSMET
eukprot:981749-Ditylum_brightwellii.AAC.1